MPDLSDVEAEFQYSGFKLVCILEEGDAHIYGGLILSEAGSCETCFMRCGKPVYAYYTDNLGNYKKLRGWLTDIFEGKIPQ